MKQEENFKNSEIDKLVAEQVMGWKVSYTVGYPEPHTIAYKDDKGKTYRAFSPSTNIEDAWMALDQVCKEHNWRAIIDRNELKTEVTFKTQMSGNVQIHGMAETPMRAICEAVLESLGITF